MASHEPNCCQDQHSIAKENGGILNVRTRREKLYSNLIVFFSLFACVETGDNICRFFLKGHCSKGNNCQFRHVRTDPSKAVVCKHWLRGLCKKGDNCEFLHEYNLRKMPECWFYSKFGECNNGAECIVSRLDCPLDRSGCWKPRWILRINSNMTLYDTVSILLVPSH